MKGLQKRVHDSKDAAPTWHTAISPWDTRYNMALMAVLFFEHDPPRSVRYAQGIFERRDKEPYSPRLHGLDKKYGPFS